MQIITAKMTAMCLCMGAKLNLDETRDLLARAGYALSPCDKTDIILLLFHRESNLRYDRVGYPVRGAWTFVPDMIYKVACVATLFFMLCDMISSTTNRVTDKNDWQI